MSVDVSVVVSDVVGVVACCGVLVVRVVVVRCCWLLRAVFFV